MNENLRELIKSYIKEIVVEEEIDKYKLITMDLFINKIKEGLLEIHKNNKNELGKLKNKIKKINDKKEITKINYQIKELEFLINTFDFLDFKNLKNINVLYNTLNNNKNREINKDYKKVLLEIFDIIKETVEEEKLEIKINHNNKKSKIKNVPKKTFAENFYNSLVKETYEYITETYLKIFEFFQAGEIIKHAYQSMKDDDFKKYFPVSSKYNIHLDNIINITDNEFKKIIEEAKKFDINKAIKNKVINEKNEQYRTYEIKRIKKTLENIKNKKYLKKHKIDFGNLYSNLNFLPDLFKIMILLNNVKISILLNENINENIITYLEEKINKIENLNDKELDEEKVKREFKIYLYEIKNEYKKLIKIDEENNFKLN